jgi:hypothetical protein
VGANHPAHSLLPDYEPAGHSTLSEDAATRSEQVTAGLARRSEREG